MNYRNGKALTGDFAFRRKRKPAVPMVRRRLAFARLLGFPDGLGAYQTITTACANAVLSCGLFCVMMIYTGGKAAAETICA